MKKFNFVLAMLMVLAFPTMSMAALAAPTNVIGGPVFNNTATIDWSDLTYTANVSQWNIYIGGVLKYQPLRSEVSIPSTNRVRYLMNTFPRQTNSVVTIRALASGLTMSPESTAVTITAIPVAVTAPHYASLSFTAIGGTVTGVTVVAGISGKTIFVVGWSISTNTAGSILIHHGYGAASSTTTIGGGYFSVGGGERADPNIIYPGLGAGLPVTLDFSVAMTTVYITVAYVTD
jgi:hypothetical protein